MAGSYGVVSAALAALLLVGCGGGNSDLPATHEIRVYPAGADTYVLPSAALPIALTDEDLWPAALWQGLDGKPVKGLFYPGTMIDIRPLIR